MPLGVDRTTFYPDGRRQPGRVLLLYHDAPRKGADDGLRALERVAGLVAGLDVHIVGTVPLATVPVGGRFELDPPDAVLRQHYSSASVLLYPSRYEGFGLPPLEAMACGTPVVTTNVGAVSEYAVSGSNAMVVPPRDVDAMTLALRAVLEGPALAARLSEEGLKTAARHDWTRVVSAFEYALL